MSLCEVFACDESVLLAVKRHDLTDLASFMISLPKDQWKRDRYATSLEKSRLKRFCKPKQWDGVLVSEQPEKLQWAFDKGYSRPLRRAELTGNVGSGLAHVTLLDHIAQQEPKNQVFLVLEDNALVTPRSMAGIELARTLEFDFFNLCAQRIFGPPADIPGAVKIVKNLNENPKATNNIWLSSYLVTPRGARLILEGMRKHAADLSTEIDIEVLRVINNSKEILAYAFSKQLRYFDHIETKGDTRKKLNANRQP